MSALQLSRRNRNSRVMASLDAVAANDARTDRVAKFGGYQGGQAIAILPNGGRVPFVPESNGSLRRGQAFLLVGNASGGYRGIWMPQ